jgi:hypothetical protein
MHLRTSLDPDTSALRFTGQGFSPEGDIKQGDDNMSTDARISVMFALLPAVLCNDAALACVRRGSSARDAALGIDGDGVNLSSAANTNQAVPAPVTTRGEAGSADALAQLFEPGADAQSVAARLEAPPAGSDSDEVTRTDRRPICSTGDAGDSDSKIPVGQEGGLHPVAK